MCFGVWGSKWLKKRPVGLIETFARFQAGFLSSEDVHRSLCIFICFHMILIDFHVFRGMGIWVT